MRKLYLSLSRYLTVLLMLITTAAWSQSRSVTGVVTSSEDGNPLPGVNIIEKGTNNGTVTDVDGNFTINVGDDATLVFSFVGYSAKEIVVGGQNVLTVALDADVRALSEVVVIGYGEVRKRDATGAVSSVKAEEFNQGMIASPEQLIQGKSAGVQITNASGEPGAGVNIRIRGTSSVRGNNNPLFVVDGIPLSGEDISAGGLDLGRGNAATKNPLNFLNPSDIESIDILKDASATAIYGSRGANGVVLITTKSGRGTKRQVEYGSSISLSRMANRFDLLNREQFLNGAEALGSSVDEIDFGADTDWQEEISRTAVSHRHDLSFSNNYQAGGFRVSLSYDDQQGVIKTSGMERLTGRLNINHAFLDEKLELGAQVTFSRINDQAAPITNNSGFEGDLIGSTYMANPTWPADPTQQFSNNNANPLSYLTYHQDQTETDRSLINLTAGYKITPDLSFRVNTGFDRSESLREKMFSPLLFLSSGVFENGRGGIAEIETSSNLLETYFNYKANVGQGELTAVLGYSYQEFNRNGATYLGYGFSSSNMDAMVSELHNSVGIIRGALGDVSWQQFGYAPANTDNPDFFVNQLFPQPSAALAINEIPASVPVRAVSGDVFDITDELQSFFGRVNYSILDKYLLTATVRADGSTRFGGNNKYGVFPSAAFAWRLSEEDFMPEVFDDFKLRLGYGITGNQEIPHNLHQGRQRFGGTPGNPLVPAAPAIENDGKINPPGLNNVAFQNPDLKWEQTSQLNFGIDFGFLTGKFSGTLDLYRKTTSDLLIQVASAQPAPQPFTWRNLDADVVNNGVELTLNYYAIDNDDAGLNFGFNIAYNSNMVKNYAGAPLNTGDINGQGLTGAFSQRIANDQPLYTYYIREFTGYEDGIAQYNGDFQRYVGKSPLPKYNLGFNLGARYKNIDFSLFLNGQFGHYVYNNTANAYFNAGSLATGRNVTTDVLTSGEAASNAPDASTRFLEKGDFLRMQNLNLGYNFNFNEKFIKKLRLFGSAQNLFLITNYSGLDPEVNVNKSRDGVPSFGIDYTTYPRARTFTFGLNATF